MEVTICEGCAELMKEEYGENMGFLPGVKVKIVQDKKDCDYLVMPDGRFQYEHKQNKRR